MNVLHSPKIPISWRVRWKAVAPVGAAAVTILLALSALAGWWLHRPMLTSLVPGWPTMKFNTAVAMLAAAASLILSALERRNVGHRPGFTWRIVALFLATWPALIGLTTLLEYSFGLQLGVDQLLFQDWFTAPDRAPGRPAPATALILLCVGLCLWIWRSPRAFVLFSSFAAGMMSLAWLSLMGMLYGVEEKFGVYFFGSTSLPTSICSLLLAAGIFFLRPAEGLARLFTSSHPAGHLARRMIPLAVILAVGLGWVRLQAQYWWQFSTEFGAAIYGTAMLVSLVFIALRGASLVDRLDVRRRRSERERERELAAREKALERLQQSEERLAASEQRFRGIFNSTFNFIGLLAPDGTMLEANQTALDLIQARREEILGRHFADTPWWAHSPAEQAKLRAGIERAAQGETVRFETSHPDEKGEVHYVDFTLKPVFDAAGKVVHLVPEGRDIGERKRAAAALEEVSSRLQLATKASGIGVWDLDLRTNGLVWDERMFSLYGLPPGTVDSAQWTQALLPEDLAEQTEIFMETIRQRGRGERLFRIRRASDGAVRIIQSAEMTVVDAKGEPARVVGINRDVTDHENAMADVAASEELLRQFIQHAPAAIAMLDTDLRYVQASDRWLKDYHLEGREIIGHSHYEIFPDVPQRWKDAHRRVLAGAVERCDEDPFYRADGGIEWLQWEVRPWRRGDGEIGGVVFYTQVITERKQAEARLRESEERFRGAFENAPIGMAMVSLKGRWMRVNRAICEIVGRTEQELLACTFQDITHPEDLETDLDHLRALVAGASDHYAMEKRYFHKSGRTIWVLLAVTMVRDAEGAPLHFVSQIEDITERHETALRLRASLEEKEVLLREIHHRVKNNMQVITSLLQLQSGYLQDPKDAAIFEECQARIHAMGLVHDRLYRSGNLSTIDFSEHLRELTVLIVRGQSSGMTRIQLEFESDPVEVNLDVAIPLGLIAAELITNAYKHAFRDQPSGVITVQLRRTTEHELTFAVADDGAGMPADFDPAKARSLGLRLIRALSRQLRAEFSIASEGRGSTMRLTLPI